MFVSPIENNEMTNSDEGNVREGKLGIKDDVNSFF